MKKIKVITYGILFSPLLLTSCYEQIVDVNFNQFGSNIVIEGNLTDNFGANIVKITKTAHVNSLEPPIPITQATITLLDDSGNMEVLSEYTAGMYRINQIRGMPGRTYTLNVLAEGHEYSAVSRMPEAMIFDSVQINRTSEVNSKYSVTIFFTDPADVENYCLIKFFLANQTRPFFQVLYHDQYSDGESIILQYEWSGLYPGNILEIRSLSLDRSVYEYFSSLLNVDEYVEPEMPDFYEISGYNPKSNIQNGALGYFSAHTIRSYYFNLQ